MSEHHHGQDVSRIKSELLLELGESITTLGMQHRALVDVSKFIIVPKQLSHGACIALLNEGLPPSNNAFKLLVVENKRINGTPPILTVYAEEKNQLNATFFRTLSEEEKDEILRQIDLLRSSVDHFSMPALFSIVFFPQPIEGYQYFEESAQRAITESSSQEERHGPTPAVLSQHSDTSTTPGGRLSELQTATPGNHRFGPTPAH